MKTIKIILILLLAFVGIVGIQYAVYNAMSKYAVENVIDEIVENENREISEQLPYHIYKMYKHIGLHDGKGNFITEVVDSATNEVYPICVCVSYVCWCNDDSVRRDIHKMSLSIGSELAGVTSEVLSDRTIYRYKNYIAEFPYGSHHFDSIEFVVLKAYRETFEKEMFIKNPSYISVDSTLLKKALLFK